jgi:serine/threonine protein kinase
MSNHDPRDVFALAGRVLENYRVERVVATGGFGVVYFARHQALNQPVALKVLKVPDALSDVKRSEFMEKFLDEAKTIASLKHPAIVSVMDFKVSPMPAGGSAPWMALEWIEGETLAQQLNRRRGMGGRSPEECLRVLAPVFDALAIAHTRGIAHRDIKPANLMVPEDGGGRFGVTTRVLDFGIAKMMSADETAGSGNTETASQFQAFSLPYAAFEQVMGTRTGPWTDVHALGLILTELLTDQPPYPGRDRSSIGMQVVAPVRPTPSRFGLDVGAWEPILARALSLTPSERFANARELFTALEQGLPASRKSLSYPPLVPVEAPVVRQPHRSEKAPPPPPVQDSTSPATTLVRRLPVPPAFVLGGVFAVLGAGGLYALLSNGRPAATLVEPPRAVPIPVVPTHGKDSGPPRPSPASPEEVSLVQFRAVYDIGLPPGMTSADNLQEFVRHAATTSLFGTTGRMIATCIPEREGGGAEVYLYRLGQGSIFLHTRARVACEGFDLGLVEDVTHDGTDDVLAVDARHDRLLVLDSRGLNTHRSIEVDGVRGVAVGGSFRTPDGPVTVLYAEPNGLQGPTEVVAVRVDSRDMLWRMRGPQALERVGQPVELGLAVGPDANSDGVWDVVVGMGPTIGSRVPEAEQRRCVMLLSGLTGQALWTQPFCQKRSPSAQAVTLGPDVNADGHADVVVGTDQPAAGEAPVVMLSGADGSVLRQWSAPNGDRAQGFGWPVSLGGDLDDNGSPDLLVGSVGAGATALTVFDTSSGRIVGRVPLGGIGAGNLRVFPVAPLVSHEPWRFLVASPADGLHLYVRSQSVVSGGTTQYDSI